MLVRIVKMSFHSEYTEKFLCIFEQKKQLIRNSPGCHFLELYRGKQDPNIFFTYSYWASENDLNTYKESMLFKETWSKTKILFNKRPEAWSVDKITSLN